jgi:hypothetical protein
VCLDNINSLSVSWRLKRHGRDFLPPAVIFSDAGSSQFITSVVFSVEDVLKGYLAVFSQRRLNKTETNCVALSSVCEFKTKGGKHLFGTTTITRGEKLVRTVDMKKFRETKGTATKHHQFLNDPSPPLAISTLSNLSDKLEKTESVKSFDDVVRYVAEARNIIVLVGAGISTSLGIPDFRSSDGLYERIRDEASSYGIAEPQQVFDINVFRSEPHIFYKFAHMLLPQNNGVAVTHEVLASLQQANKLRTIYTQNIDDKEIVAGIDEGKLVQLHGTMRTFSCTTCNVKGAPCDQIIEEKIRAREIPKCPKCFPARTGNRVQKARQTSQRVSSRARGPAPKYAEYDNGEKIARGILKV